LADCNGSAAQDFQFDFDTSTLSMPRLSPVLCFDLFGPVRNGMAVYVGVCNGSGNQKWAFPWNGRLRPVGADADKCLTHDTREGKPEIGWTLDIVTDPNCDFPSEGGGGVCFPSFMAFWEMVIWDCDDRNEQQWRMPPPGGTGCQLNRPQAGSPPVDASLTAVLAVLLLAPMMRRLRWRVKSESDRRG
jgi:hypothetical protein